MVSSLKIAMFLTNCPYITKVVGTVLTMQGEGRREV